MSAMSTARRLPAVARAGVRGLSVVELMVSLAVGLLVLAAAIALLAAAAAEARRTTLEARLMQDLRAGTDTLARALRRAGYWGSAADAVAAGRVSANPYRALASDAGVTTLRFSRDAVENGSVDPNEQFGLRLRGGVVELQFGSAGWQAVTDASTLTVTALRVTPVTQETIVAPGACGARHRARQVDLLIEGRATQAASVVRSLATRIALRNHLLVDPCNA